ncbi:MAG: hydrogenase maturation nickel metallochaperone HypA [Bacillota bacterium]|nr:hydrogenase maturation nickel metallochaperone HypA [Bacillota bacterium]
MEKPVHELGIASSILEIVTRAVEEKGLQRVTRLKVVVGETTAVVPDALSFAFEAISRGTCCEVAQLEIEERPFRARCRQCGEEFRVEEYRLICPRCGQRDAQMISGDELYVDHVEAE